MKSKKEISYHRILMNIILLLSIMVVFLYIVLYRYFEYHSIESTVKKAIENIKQVSDDMQAVEDSAVSVGASAIINNDVYKLLYGIPDFRESGEAVAQLNYLRITSQYVDSIYVYNRSEQMIYSTMADHSGSFSSGNFFDQEIIAAIEEGDVRNRECVARMMPARSNTNREKAVYSYFISNDLNNYFIVVNVLISSTNKLTQDLDCETLVVDDKGCLLNFCQAAPILSDISGLDYVARVLSEEGAEGYFIDKTDDKQLVIYIREPESGIFYIRIFPYDQITGALVSMRNISILITMLVLVLGILLAGVWTRRIYRPINQMAEMLEKMQAENRENKYMSRQNILRMLFENENTDQRHFQKKLEKYDIRLKDSDSFYAVALKTDKYAAFSVNNSQEDRGLLRFAIANIAHEVAGWEFENETIEMPENCILLLLKLQEDCCEAEELISKKIRSLCKKIQEKVEEYMNISVSCIFSGAGRRKELPLLYQKIKDAEQYQLYCGKGFVVSATEILSEKRQRYVYSSEREKELVAALNAGNLKEIKDRYLEIIDSLYFYPPNVLYANLLRLLVVIDDATSHWEYHVTARGIYNDIAGELVRCTDIHDMNQMFFDFFDMIIEKQQNWKGSKHLQMIDKINLMITEESSNKSLSLDLIADRLNMTTDYVGKLYKKYTGKSIVIRINEERMENAKSLLTETRLSISEISDRVGFSSDKYFFTLFKKMNGITPNEYRMKNVYEKKQ